MTAADPITPILNTVGALKKAGLTSYTEVAAAIGETPKAVSDWVGSRRHRPHAAAAFALRDFAAKETRRLSRLGETTERGRELHAKYRAAHIELSSKFPGNGSNGKAE